MNSSKENNYFYKALFPETKSNLGTFRQRVFRQVLRATLGNQQDDNLKLKYSEYNLLFGSQKDSPNFTFFEELYCKINTRIVEKLSPTANIYSIFEFLLLQLGIIFFTFIAGMGDNPWKWPYKLFTVPASMIIEFVASGLRESMLSLNISMSEFLNNIIRNHNTHDNTFWVKTGYKLLIVALVIAKIIAMILQLSANTVAFFLHGLNHAADNLTNSFTIFENKTTMTEEKEETSWGLSENFKARFPRTAALLVFFGGIATWLGTLVITPNATGTLGTVIETITTALPSWKIAGVAILSPVIAKAGILIAASVYAASIASQTIDLYDEIVDMVTSAFTFLKKTENNSNNDFSPDDDATYDVDDVDDVDDRLSYYGEGRTPPTSQSHNTSSHNSSAYSPPHRTFIQKESNEHSKGNNKVDPDPPRQNWFNFRSFF